MNTGNSHRYKKHFTYTRRFSIFLIFPWMSHLLYITTRQHAFNVSFEGLSLSAGKFSAEAAAPLSENFHKLSGQEIFLHLAGNYCHGMPCNLVIVYIQKRFATRDKDCLLPRLKFSTIYVLWNLHMQGVLYFTYTGIFYVWIIGFYFQKLRKRNIFLCMPAVTLYKATAELFATLVLHTNC